MPLGTGAAGGLGALGVLIMPLSIAAMMFKQPPGPVARLIAAGAVSPETARRLEGVGIPRAFVLEPAMRRGVVHRTSDGRHWVDVPQARRHRRRTIGLVAGVALVIGAIVWSLIFLPGGPGPAAS